jgi:lipopolysaccharide heptosyltransferase II
MKIIQVVPRMNVGGVERGVVDFARYFQGKQHQIIVVSGGGRLVPELEARGVKHYQLNVYKKSPLSLLTIRQLRKIIIQEGADIVHARSRVPAWISFFATRGTGADFVTTAHGFYSVHFFSEVMGWGKYVICPSGIIAKHMHNNFGVDNKRIKIVSRWVKLDRFPFVPYQQKPQRPSLIAIGRISPSKGYQYLIEAMRKVVRSNPYATLSIVGSVDKSKVKYFNYLRSLVQRYSLDYNVKFLGYRSDVADLLNESRLLVMPSVIQESFGRIIIEAFACGVPVVASKVGAIPEIIKDQHDGLIVPPKDPSALSTAILEVINDPSFAARMTDNARKKVVQRYSADHCISQVIDIYQQTKQTKNILVIKISSLGDLILAIPSLKSIKDSFPKSHLTLVTMKKYTSLFYDCPYVDEVIGLDDDYKNFSYILRTTKFLRRQNYDYLIDLQNSRTSHLISWLTFARISAGYRRKLGFLLTRNHKLPTSDTGPLASQEKILKLVGISLKEKRLSFWPLKQTPLRYFNLAPDQDYIAINVAASAKWQSKNWPPEHIIKLIKMIYKNLTGYKVVLLGDKKSAAIAQSVSSGVKDVIDLSGKTTIRELALVLSKAKAFVTPDTASLHLAVALGIPTVGLFGPTNPRAHTVDSDNLSIISKEIDCSFCYKNTCPSVQCMEKITPREVFNKIKKAI